MSHSSSSASPRPLMKEGQDPEITKGIVKDASLPTALPDDLLIEVFLRLPSVRSIGRSRCVCRQWRSLTSSRCFADAYLARSGDKVSYLTNEFSTKSGFILPNATSMEGIFMAWGLDEEGRARYRGFSPEFISSCQEDVLMSNPCNGLFFFMVCPRNSEEIRIRAPTRTYLMNLTTQECAAMIPRSENYRVSITRPGLAFNTTRKEYKVVDFYRSGESSRIWCDVLTLGGNSWRTVATLSPRKKKLPPRKKNKIITSAVPVLANGALHWTVKNSEKIPTPSYILAFNIEDEDFKAMPVPKFGRRFRLFRPVLQELGGNICFMQNIPGKIDVWILKDYSNGTWVKQYSVDVIFHQPDLPAVSFLKDFFPVIPEINNAVVTLSSVCVKMDYSAYVESLVSPQIDF